MIIGSKSLDVFCRRVSVEGQFKGHFENIAEKIGTDGVSPEAVWAVYLAWCDTEEMGVQCNAVEDAIKLNFARWIDQSLVREIQCVLRYFDVFSFSMSSESAGMLSVVSLFDRYGYGLKGVGYIKVRKPELSSDLIPAFYMAVDM